MNGITRSKVRWLCALFLVVGLSAPGMARAEESWVEFESKKAGFTVEAPVQPTATQSTTKSFIGDVTNDIFTAMDGDQKMTVDFSKIPDFALHFAGAETIYEHAKGALLSQTWSKPISFTDIMNGPHAGKRLVYDTPPVPGKPDFYGEAHFFLIGDRLYVVDAAVPSGESEADAKRFLGSIEFD